MSLAAGTSLGPYTIVRPLGAGNFGAVYLATRARDGAPFALKVVHLFETPGSALYRKPSKGAPTLQSQAAGLLYQEYLAFTQHVRWHPHLPVLPQGCFGDDERAWRWLAMQPLGGGTLRTALAHGPPPFSTTATLALQLIDVLAHVHAAGWVYVDVNADNVLFGGAQPTTGMNAPRDGARTHPGRLVGVTDRLGPPPRSAPGDGSRAYLIDFGLARTFRGFDRKGAAATQALGTPLYSATAFARGTRLSPRDDLESLGYLLVSAAAPRGADSLPWASATSDDQVSALKLASTPASLSALVPAGAPRTAIRAYLEVVHKLTPDAAASDAGPDYAELKGIFEKHAHPDGILIWAGADAGASVGTGAGAGASAGASAVAGPGMGVKRGRKKQLATGERSAAPEPRSRSRSRSREKSTAKTAVAASPPLRRGSRTWAAACAAAFTYLVNDSEEEN